MTLPAAGGTVTYQYDPFGRRIEKISPTGTTVYAYDGDNVVEELDGGGTAVARYAQGLGIDEPLAMYRGGASYYYNADGLGSITSLTNSSGQIAATYTYDSFGKLTASTGTVTNPFRYTGREYGSDTGLYYYRARYYDSSVGRFISEDPLRHLAGTTNFYDYASNGPASTTDPFGLKRCKRPCKVDIPNVDQIQTALDTMLGEVSPESASGTHVYQEGDVYGHPTGPVISDDDLDSEAYMIASTMVNRGNAVYGSGPERHNLTLDDVVGQPGQYAAYEGENNLHRLHWFENSYEGDAKCRMLRRVIDSLLKAANHPARYSNYRAVRQPGGVLTRHWSHVVAGTSFF